MHANHIHHLHHLINPWMKELERPRKPNNPTSQFSSLEPGLDSLDSAAYQWHPWYGTFCLPYSLLLSLCYTTRIRPSLNQYVYAMTKFVVKVHATGEGRTESNELPRRTGFILLNPVLLMPWPA